tara:strand:+ start:272 stop:406 length:135 start_codon:yes stop_codon:yes gene_type:complete
MTFTVTLGDILLGLLVLMIGGPIVCVTMLFLMELAIAMFFTLII